MEVYTFAAKISTFWAGLAAQTKPKGSGETISLWFPFQNLIAFVEILAWPKNAKKKIKSPTHRSDLIFFTAKNNSITARCLTRQHKNELKAQNLRKKAKNTRKNA